MLSKTHLCVKTEPGDKEEKYFFLLWGTKEAAGGSALPNCKPAQRKGWRVLEGEPGAHGFWDGECVCAAVVMFLGWFQVPERKD